MKILYVRSGPYKPNIKGYNMQEIGAAKAFCKMGYSCDIVYYSDRNEDQVIYHDNGCKITILWRKGIKILRTGIYFSLLKRDLLSQYDFIIVTEYSQIMSVLIGHLADNVYLYNGPYYNLFKIPLIQPIYDALFNVYLNKKMKKIYVKSELAKQFLENRKFNNVKVVGVGLDIEKYESEKEIKKETKELIKKMNGKRNLLYVGSLSKRKNFEFLIKVFQEINREYKDEAIQLVVVGNGKANYIKACINMLNDEERDSVVICEFIDNEQLKYIYPIADVFLLPSVQEIFGMVLLEAMYFSVPVISSLNGGSATLINNGENGIIISEFKVDKWVEAIKDILSDSNLRKEIGVLAHKTIKEEYIWDAICKKMIDCIEV